MLKRNLFRKDTFTLAGWLFADLFLGISFIFLLITAQGNYQKIIALTATTTLTPASTRIPTNTFSPSISPTISYSPTSTSTKTPTGTKIPEGPVGLGEPQCYNIQVGSGEINEDEIVEFLRGKIPNSKNSLAGLVLVWTHGKEGIAEGVEISKQIRNILRTNFPKSFGNSQYKSLGFEKGVIYEVQLEIYFLTDKSWESGSEKSCYYIR